MSSTSAVFVGDGTLLVRCAQAWLEAGHRVVFIATRSAEIAHWAQEAGLAHRRFGAREPLQAPDVACDYLFSVANLEVLPHAFLALPRRLAVNFHDGPLPRYAGLNAPAWALLNGESEHGITWHEMTARVDAGRIVRQARFAVAAGETALGLNARCYEAGLAAFAQIAADAAHGELALTEQSGPRTWFGRDRRPDALATIGFGRSARDIVALVKALDFGTYANPLGRPKLLLPGRTVIVRDAQADPAASNAPPGTVVRSTADTVTVATACGDVVLTLAEPVAGWPQHLPRIDAALRGHLAAATPAIARGERHWTAALMELAPAELPYPRELAAGTGTRIVLEARAEGEKALGSFLAWLRALCAQDRVTVLVCDPVLTQAARGLERWLQDVVPCDGDIAAVRAAGPFARDLPSRLGERLPVLEDIRLAVALDGRIELPPHAELMLSIQGDRMELVAGPVYARDTVECMARHLSHWFDVGTLLPDAEREQIAALNDTACPFESATAVHEAVSAQARRTPDRVAVECGGTQLTYREFDERSTALARRLVAAGVKPGDIVGLALERGARLLVALQAILKAGGAYLPLDPEYPRERLDFMIEDSGTKLVLTESTLASLPAESPEPLPGGDPARRAYVIYTSGSTGKPKGVEVTHRNVMNFFAGMDGRIDHDPPGRWLAVTSLSFDISVLELCWTLARGFTVVLHGSAAPAAAAAPEFSLFYFASDHASTPQDRYRVLMEGAKFGDQNGFAAVWTPERHFHAFGGLYPNPAVTGAAIAACTSRIRIRAGSCVLPLHHPIRVAEEWAFVDNISQGRVGISFASGWQPNDFVIAPQAFADRKDAMLRNIDVVRRLWRGEKLPFPGPHGKDVEVQTLPRPIQHELPVWVTAAGNPQTFEQAGTLGCHLLTHLLGQSLDDVAEKLKLYRAAWHKAGHAGRPQVTLMLHTFVGDDEAQVRETVRKPMKDYLRSSVDLIRQAAWSFPTFVQRAAQDGRNPVEIMEQQPLSEEEMDALLEHAFSRYYGSSALFGTKERCLEMVRKLRDAGVDEIACLIDFGIPSQTVLDHLHHLKALMDAARAMQPAAQRVSVAEQLLAGQATHLQCTPSMASMLVADAAGRAALSQLRSLMVGGEALPPKLAKDLRALVPGQLVNMYGPTETTIWSTTCELAQIGDFVPLGTPIANTQLRVVNMRGEECPALVPGELLIGGEGVAPGYLGRPQLTAERFITDAGGARWYRTGDLVRRRPGGAIEFLGRIDHQVKIRGHRIELGEIESVLAKQPGVKDAVVIARGDASGGKRLLGYVTARAGAAIDAQQLRLAVASELPQVMVPQAVLVLPAFPSTPNGKVDRKALPEPNAVIAVRPPTVSAPNTELEQTIAAIWQDVLGLPQVGTGDNFFDLGGHSLLVVQVQRRLREACGREVSITDMFRLPTIKALAAHLGGADTHGNAVNDGLARAQARRMMRSRAAAANPTA